MLPRYVNIAVFGFLLHQSIAFARPHGDLYSRSQGVDRNSIESLQVRNNLMLTPNAPVTIRNRDNIPRTADSANPRYQNFKRYIQNDLAQSISTWLDRWDSMNTAEQETEVQDLAIRLGDNTFDIEEFIKILKRQHKRSGN